MALVVTRKTNEEIIIGDPEHPIATVRVSSIRGDRVRLAVDASDGVPINRREVADAIVEQHAGMADRSVGCVLKTGAQPVDQLSAADGCAPGSATASDSPAAQPSATDRQHTRRLTTVHVAIGSKIAERIVRPA